MIIDDGFGPVQVNIDGYDIEGKNKLYYEYGVKGGGDDEEFMESKEVQEQIANDEEIHDKYSKSELYAMAEREEGKEEEKLEIAENLLKRNIDIWYNSRK